MKNRIREAPLFANLNLLGTCNLNCTFCLGKDLGQEAQGIDVRTWPADKLPNLNEYLGACRQAGIERIYVTGQNTDPLMYADLPRLIDICREAGFTTVGIRTNGVLGGARLYWLDRFDSIGFTVLTQRDSVQKALTGRPTVPNIWPLVRRYQSRCRVSTVVTYHNIHEVVRLMENAAICGAKYGQIRRVSSDTRRDEALAHQEAFDDLSERLLQTYRRVGEFAGAPVIEIAGMPVTLWKTVETTVNSYNWFANGTWTREYFVVESFLGKRFE